VKKVLFAFALAGTALGAAWAQSSQLKPTFGFYGGDTWAAIPYGGVDGIELVPGVPSRALAYFGGGYWQDGYYRDVEGNERQDPAYAFDGAYFHSWGLEGRLGMDVGLVREAGGAKNALYAQGYIKSVWRDNADQSAVIRSSSESDRDGYWENSLFSGLVLDRMKHDQRSRSHEGLYSQASCEWAPGFAANDVLGKADWWRLNAQTQLFWRPVKTDAFVLYLGDKMVGDYVGGGAIPSHVQRQIGGFYTYTQGCAMRGIGAWRYDGNVKLLNSVDLRMTFPVVPLQEVVPEIILFADQGLIDNRDWFKSGEGTFLSTAGSGIVLDLVFMGIPMDFGWYLSYSMTEDHWNYFNLIIMSH
jgi:Surface antigen.